jgi:hypothetical protein
MASLAAMQYALANPNGPKPSVYAYAAPHPGNVAFAGAFAALNLCQTRYENNLDIVPMFPPVSTIVQLMQDDLPSSGLDPIWVSVLTALLTVVSNWNYAPVFGAVGSAAYYIPASGPPEPIGFSTDIDQWEALKGAINAHNYSAIAEAHCPLCQGTGCGGGYMAGVCAGTGLCS